MSKKREAPRLSFLSTENKEDSTASWLFWIFLFLFFGYDIWMRGTSFIDTPIFLYLILGLLLFTGGL